MHVPPNTRKTLLPALIIGLVTLSIAIDVRPWNPQERFIGHADEADTALLARNIANGDGATLDIIRFLRGGGVDAPDIRHAERYSSIYASAFVSVFFWLFGPCRTTLLLSASFAKAVIAVIACLWVHRFTKKKLPTLTCCTCVLYSPQMQNLVSGLTDIYVAMAFLISASLLVLALRNQSFLVWLSVGVAVGVSVGFKPTGLLLLPAAIICASVNRGSVSSMSKLAVAAIGCVISLVPLGLHNYRAGGTVLLPDLALVNEAMYEGIAQGGGYEADMAAFFSPEERHYKPLSTGQQTILQIKFFYSFCILIIQGKIVPTVLLLVTVPSVFRQFLQWIRHQEVELYLQTFTIASFVVLCGGICLAFFVTPEPRYWGFMIPLMAVIACTEIDSLPLGFSRPCLLSAGFGVLISGLIDQRLKTPDVNQTFPVCVYETVTTLIPPGARVMTCNPAEFTFHTKRRSVMAPFSSKMDTYTNVAKKYGVQYFVVVNGDIRVPELRPEWNEGRFPPGIELVFKDKQLVIGEFSSN
jgi:hypothetical protein